MKTCSKCGKPIEEFCEFPGKRGGVVCLACYEQEYDATPQDEYNTIVGAFSGGIINTRKTRATA